MKSRSHTKTSKNKTKQKNTVLFLHGELADYLFEDVYLSSFRHTSDIVPLIFQDVVGRGCSNTVALETVAIKTLFQHLPPHVRKKGCNEQLCPPTLLFYIYDLEQWGSVGGSVYNWKKIIMAFRQAAI